MPAIQTKPSAKRRVAHNFDERKCVVELYRSGLGSRRIAREMGLADSTVRLWLRRYRAYGLDSLRPYWRAGTVQGGVRESRREENERTFQPAFTAYATTLEPIASITRRYGLDYQSFKYHIERFHPDLVAQRASMRESVGL